MNNLKILFKWLSSPLPTDDEFAALIFSIYKLWIFTDKKHQHLAGIGFKKVGILSLKALAFILPVILIIKFIQNYFTIIIVALALIIGGVYWILKVTSNQITSQPRGDIIYPALFKVVTDMYQPIGAVNPIDIDSINEYPSVVERSGVLLLKVKILKSFETTRDIAVVKSLLQGRINERLLNGTIDNTQYAFVDIGIPAIYIDDILDGVTHYHLDVLYVSNRNDIQYVYHRQLSSNPKHYEPMDRDFGQ